MIKSRVSSAHYGSTDDLLYYAYSSGLAADPGCTKDTLEMMRVAYANGLAKRGTLLPTAQYMGTELFSSSTNRRPQMNSCDHINSRLYNIPFGILYRRYTGSYTYKVPYTRVAFPLVLTPAGDIPKSVYMDALAPAQRRAYHNMIPRFEGKLDGLNALVELKDFKGILKSASKAPHMFKNARRYFRKMRKKLPPNPSLTAAQAYLAYNLAYAPLARDIATSIAQMETAAADAQVSFHDAGKSMQSSHFTEHLYEDDSGLIPGTSNNYWKAQGKYYNVTFTATLHYTYSYRMRNAGNAFAKYWGLNMDAEAFWNGIPFSFVADYFIGIGDAIHAAEKDPNVILGSTQYCESLLSSFTSGVHYRPDPRCVIVVPNGSAMCGSSTSPFLLSGIEGTHYIRDVKLPNKGLATPRLRLPSGKNALTMGALVRALI